MREAAQRQRHSRGLQQGANGQVREAVCTQVIDARELGKWAPGRESHSHVKQSSQDLEKLPSFSSSSCLRRCSVRLGRRQGEVPSARIY